MIDLYSECEEYYKRLCQLIIKRNKKLMDSIKSEKSSAVAHSKPTKQLVTTKIHIPYVEPDPHSKYITVVSRNLFTQDEPILKFIPSINCSSDITSFSWFDGTEVGSRRFTSRDFVDGIFQKYCSRNKMEETAAKFLGRKMEEKMKIKSMGDLFCNVCMLFDCGIHQVVKSDVSSFQEEPGCICGDSVTAASDVKKIRSSKFSEEVDFMHNSFKLKKCIISKLQKTPHSSADVDQIPIKKVFPIKKLVVTSEFFTPCSSAQCTRACRSNTCTCHSSDISCELSCGCVRCSNVVYCSCEVCGEGCYCRKNNRECIEGLCGCSHQTTEKERKCRVLQGSNRRALKIGKSQFHGFGLYSNESLIKKGEYVIEYTGEIITDKEAERRGNFYEANRCSFLFDLVKNGQDSLYSVDGFAMGNKSRYINHSRRHANLESQIRIVEGLVKIAFFALRDIYKGEELLFDYKFNEKQAIKHNLVD